MLIKLARMISHNKEMRNIPIYLLLLFTFRPVLGATIDNLRVVKLKCSSSFDKQPKIAIRQMIVDGKPHFLVVNPINLKTRVIQSQLLRCGEIVQPDELFEKPYMKAVQEFAKTEKEVQGNVGFKRFDPKCSKSGVVVTIDMCPGSKPFQQEYFQAVANFAKSANSAVSVGIAVTRSRIEKNPQELIAIREIFGPLENQGKISITWINHSATHPYERNKPYEENFLTKMNPEDFLEKEVLATERAMLERGLTPSVFFRFPGLMSSRSQVEILKRAGLIALGTTARLAMDGERGKYHDTYDLDGDQKLKPGRVVLTHGNGGEPTGVKTAIEHLTNATAKHDHPHFISVEEGAKCGLEVPHSRENRITEVRHEPPGQ